MYLPRVPHLFIICPENGIPLSEMLLQIPIEVFHVPRLASEIDAPATRLNHEPGCNACGVCSASCSHDFPILHMASAHGVACKRRGLHGRWSMLA
jgi:ferredoxin